MPARFAGFADHSKQTLQFHSVQTGKAPRQINGLGVVQGRLVNEPPLSAEPSDPKYAGHRAPARRQDCPEQQHMGMPPTPLLEERREA